MTAAEIVSRFPGARRSGKEWVAQCPAHPDKNPSLSIREADGRILLHCHAGCSVESICEAVGIETSDLFLQQCPASRMIAEYCYTDERGNLLYVVERREPKDFRQRRPDGRGGWIWNLNGTRRVLYRLPEVLKAKSVLVCEGEKDCETARTLRLVATCNPGGAGKWRDEYSEPLRGKRIAIITDADEPGREHAEQVASSLSGKAESVKTLELAKAKDLSEWVEKGGTRETLLELIRNASEWKPGTARRGKRIVLVPADEFLKRTSCDEREWLVEGFLPACSQTIWQGRPKAGKSHSLLQLVFDLSAGLPVFGKFSAKRPVRCTYVELEEPEAITKARYAQMLRANSGQGPDSGNFHFFTREDLHRLHLLPRELLGSCLRDFISALRDTGSELVVLIALRRFLQNDENLNDGETAERINDALDMILEQTHTAIALAHHDRKRGAETVEAQGFGSTFVSARADGVFDLARAGEGIRRVRCEARFDAPEEFFLRKTSIGDGEVIRFSEAPHEPKREKREEALRRVRAGESTRKAAQVVGVSHTTVQNWVNDAEETS
jgi:5S rRNA maturation endonuclease (ribonuclease M5)